jgi:hypothetical protein
MTETIRFRRSLVSLLRTRSRIIIVLCALLAAGTATAQSVEITGIPNYKKAGTLTGVVSGIDPATHKVVAYIDVEGNNWWTKSTGATINPDGSFSVNIGTDGLDEYASTYCVAVVPKGTNIPDGSEPSNILPSTTVASDWVQRYGRSVQFAGRSWGVKDSPSPVGPGTNRFSAEENDVWVDEAGMHLTIHRHGGSWYSSEVVLTENLGYGTYYYRTECEVEDLNTNATFGAFTWDNFGDDPRITAWPWREIDFEDSRWGKPGDPTTSQTVIQPYDVPGNLARYTTPDLSGDPRLTRAFTWSPGRIEWIAALGNHSPQELLAGNIPPGDIIDQRTYLDNGAEHLVPDASRENFRFNLWLNQSAPADNKPVEVLITNFMFIPLLRGDYDGSGLVDASDFSTWRDSFGRVVAPFSGADGNGDGVIDEADYRIWRDNLGLMLNVNGGSGMAVVVPEPKTVCQNVALFTALALLRAAR